MNRTGDRIGSQAIYTPLRANSSTQHLVIGCISSTSTTCLFAICHNSAAQYIQLQVTDTVIVGGDELPLNTVDFFESTSRYSV